MPALVCSDARRVFEGLDAKYLLVGSLVLVGIAASIAVQFLIRRRASRVVAGRRPLSAEEFAALFAAEREREAAPLIRDRLRPYIPVNPGLVLPDDRLCEELQLAVQDGLDANSFVRDVEKMLGVKIPDKAAQNMYTLRDIISYVGAHKQ